MKRVAKIILTPVLTAVVATGGLFGWLTATEYKPQPYDPSDTKGTQHYVIDGLILSPNVELKRVETLDEGFENSDHNPVKVQVVLKDS